MTVEGDSLVEIVPDSINASCMVASNTCMHNILLWICLWAGCNAFVYKMLKRIKHDVGIVGASLKGF